MPIQFRCPHCKKGISAKEELAGKKVKCPACKRPLTVPAQAAPPAPDAEELAMAVLGEKPAEAPAPQAKPIDFTCPQCDEPVQAPYEMAGKQMPCPHCRRIVRVPMPARSEPKDWRKAQTAGPSGARQNLEQPPPEGAWGSAAAGRASFEALEQAGAIPEAKEKLTVAQWVRRGALAVVVVLVLGGGGWWVWSTLRGNAEARALSQAIYGVKKDPKKKDFEDKDWWDAEVHRAAGEYYLQTNTRGCLGRALPELRKARAMLANAPANTGERDALLIELALTFIDLGGSGPEVDNDQRASWDRAPANRPVVAKELMQTLPQLRGSDARLFAAREVSRKLIAKGQPQLAAQVAAPLASGNDTLPEVEAVVGLEMLKSHPAQAEAAATQALEMIPPAGKGGADAPPPGPSLIALCLALNKQDLIAKLPAEAKEGAASKNREIVLGWIEGTALQGNASSARQATARLSGADRLRGYLALAAAEESQQPDAARQDLEDAVKGIETELRDRAPPWQVVRLVRLGARVGLPDKRLKGLPGAIRDPGMRPWAQLEVLRAQLAASKAVVGTDQAGTVEGKTAAAYVAREALARHNAQLDGNTLANVQKWEEPYRPFGLVGAVLGRQDGR
jgi:hypothetical protein